jgi:predicted dehydrogenase
MEKVRWGFIGAGMIAKKALWPALLNSEVGEIYAVAARDEARAKALSPSGRIYTNYDDLLADPNVEAIYISLPNSLHMPWSIRALEAGKNVLCEKPLAMNAAEVRDRYCCASKEREVIYGGFLE